MVVLRSVRREEFISGEVYLIKVKPNSSKSGIFFDAELKSFVVFVHSPPENNKANLELIKLFRKCLKLKVEIVSGLKSRYKKILIK